MDTIMEKDEKFGVSIPLNNWKIVKNDDGMLGEYLEITLNIK